MTEGEAPAYAFMLQFFLAAALRWLWFTEQRYTILRGKPIMRIMIAFGTSCLLFVAVFSILSFIWEESPFGTQVLAASAMEGIFLFFFAFLASLIRSKEEKRIKEIKRVWAILVGLVLLSFGYIIASKFYGLPSGNEQINWDIGSLVIFSLALFMFTLRFVRELRLIRVIVGLLPFGYPMISMIIRSIKV